MTPPLTRPSLESLPVRTLRNLAGSRGIYGVGLSRDDLIQALLEWAALERAQ